LGVCDASLEIFLLRLFTSRKSSSWAIYSNEVSSTAPFCPTFAFPFKKASVHSVLPCT
jgi:hypothetical protein